MQNNQKGFIQYIAIIIVILAVAIFSQQPQFRAKGKQLYTQSASQGSTYWQKAQNWFYANIWPKVSGEVSKAKETASKEITTQKNNFLESVWEKIKTYLAEKFSSTFGTTVK